MNRTHTIALVAALSALRAGAVQAQAVYRIVGPDGRVTFSDRAPEDLSKGAKVSTHEGVQTGADLHANDALPFALRQTATRYPVVLYTGKDCGPCVNGCNLLINRGIPFAERTVTSNEDVEALQGLAGDASLPVVHRFTKDQGFLRYRMEPVPGCRRLSQDIRTAGELPTLRGRSAGGARHARGAEPCRSQARTTAAARTHGTGNAGTRGACAWNPQSVQSGRNHFLSFVLRGSSAGSASSATLAPKPRARGALAHRASSGPSHSLSSSLPLPVSARLSTPPSIAR